MSIYDVAVVGAGAGGQMAVLRSVLNNQSTIVFTGSPKTNKKSRAMWVSKVVNMPYFADIPRPISAGTKSTFEWIAKDPYFSTKFASNSDSVSSIQKLPDGNFQLKNTKGEEFLAKFVVLATGVMDVQPEISGAIWPVLPYANNGHIDYCMRCDGHKSLGKITATIGHKNSAAHVAITLFERYQPPAVKIFTHGKPAEFTEESQALISRYGIKVIPETIVGIEGDPKVAMTAFKLANGSSEAVEIAFPMLGQIAYNELAVQLGANINEKGNVVCNAKGESSVAGLYVVGDLRDTGKYQIYTAWDQAVDSVDDIDSKLRQAFRESYATIKS